jgi:hypothetical protein
MAFLAPHYSLDAFVSYSHGDPKRSGDSPLRTWSLALIKTLRDHIYSLSTEFDDIAIWCDEQIDPTAKLTETLRSTVKSAAILIVLMSPRYLKSSWCTDERAWFESQVKDRVKDLSCVLVVRVVSTRESEWPAFLLDERGQPPIGFCFHPPTDKPEVEPYGWPDLVERPEPFRKELSTFRTVLMSRLREVKERVQRRHAPQQDLPIHSGGRRPRLYLHARPEDSELRGQVEQALSSIGCDPLTIPSPTGNGLSDWNRESAQRIQFAQRCDALALLRGADDRFVGDLVDVGIDDRERIAAARGRGFPCAVLDATLEPLPPIAATYGIERFSLNKPHWETDFRFWIDKARPPGSEASA